MKYFISLTPIFFLLFVTGCKKDESNLAASKTKTIDERVDELLAQMTLEEKVGQMTQAERSALRSTSDIKTYFLGSLLSGGGSAPVTNAPTSWADMYDAFQTYALQTRLKIP